MRSFRGTALFVRGYNDVEALTPEQVEIKRQYIRNNPRKRLIVQSRPDRFHVWRNCRSAGWTLERAMAAIAADRWIGSDPAKCRLLPENVRARLTAGGRKANSRASSFSRASRTSRASGWGGYSGRSLRAVLSVRRTMLTPGWGAGIWRPSMV